MTPRSGFPRLVLLLLNSDPYSMSESFLQLSEDLQFTASASEQLLVHMMGPHHWFFLRGFDGCLQSFVDRTGCISGSKHCSANPNKDPSAGHRSLGGPDLLKISLYQQPLRPTVNLQFFGLTTLVAALGSFVGRGYSSNVSCPHNAPRPAPVIR